MVLFSTEPIAIYALTLNENNNGIDAMNILVLLELFRDFLGVSVVVEREKALDNSDTAIHV